MFIEIRGSSDSGEVSPVYSVSSWLRFYFYVSGSFSGRVNDGGPKSGVTCDL